MNSEKILVDVKRIYIKNSEIISMMKRGEFIAAFEKINGVQKILGALGSYIEKTQNDNNHNSPVREAE